VKARAAAFFAALCALTLAGPVPAAEGDAIRFAAGDLFGTAHGTFRTWRVTEAHIDLADPGASTVTVEVDLTSVDTGIEDRDEHLQSDDFFYVAIFPVATVRVHDAEAFGMRESAKSRYRAQFDIDLHGERKTLPGEFTVLSTNPFVVEGALTLNRLDFGIGEPHSRWNPFSISDEVSVTFRAEIERE
jgi:polyisoprenoid-binding protein YceI